LILGFLCGCQSRQALYKDSRLMMGTFVEVASPDKEAAGIVFSEIARIEGLLSKYNEDSEIARLNKLGELEVSDETLYILRKAREFWQASDGAFDISVGPLVDLWGFTDKKYLVPEEKIIKKTLGLVGTDKIIFNPGNNVIKFKFRGMKIDLGAIAKGYALDRAVRRLRESGVKSCLINAGGNVYCLGDKFGKPWNVAVKDPRRPGFTEYLKLQDGAVATSGDYEQYFMHQEKRYAHIFNPKTGYPAQAGVVCVTVVAPDALTADALATAIFVLGKDKGLKLAERFQDVKIEIAEEKDV